jgi:hypothetical protein
MCEVLGSIPSNGKKKKNFKKKERKTIVLPLKLLTKPVPMALTMWEAKIWRIMI